MKSPFPGMDPFLEMDGLWEGFHGHPLRKDFPLLARFVKPWPGLVDVEAMPGDETPAPAAIPAGDEDAS